MDALWTGFLLQLLFALPCAVMMFMCMKGMSQGKQAQPAQDSALEDKTSASNPAQTSRKE